jgi:DNA-binding MarR family transcriptional regulator
MGVISKMYEENIPTPEKLLLLMHNLCIVRPELAKTGEELSQTLRIAVDHALQILREFERDGYVKSYTGQHESRQFYLTGRGILKVCSSFT